MLFKFPKNFYWGAAASAHQVEGGNNNDWSVWEKENAEWLAGEVKKKRPKWQQEKFPEMLDPRNYVSSRACGHYNRFEEDFDIAKSLGHNAHRFSIEWSRIEPAEGKFNEAEIEHYRKVIRSLRERGMEPFVTLWHWPVPLWLRDKGGWESRETPKYFARYAEKIVSEFKNDVKFWVTLNEPEVYTSLSYLIGIWPPQKKNPISYFLVLRNLIKAHRAVYEAIKKIRPDAQVGIAKNNVYFSTDSDSFQNQLLKRLADWWWNSYFLNQISNRVYKRLDFIGLNYYFHNNIKYNPLAGPAGWFNQNENKIVSDIGWELYPEGIYHVLKDLQKYGKPVYITENGLADAKDEKRGWFIKESLKNVHRAIQEGADVRGYFYWSLLDNFEWDKGFWPRFGLVEVDYKSMERKIRPSAKAYAEICKNNGFEG